MKKLFKIEIPDNRNFGLDLLRFIAIFTVLISHSITVLPEKYYVVHKFIFDGVLVFFVLSGFLIGRIFIRDFENGFSLKKMVDFLENYLYKHRFDRFANEFSFKLNFVDFVRNVN